jgi:hypothetical protein
MERFHGVTQKKDFEAERDWKVVGYGIVHLLFKCFVASAEYACMHLYSGKLGKHTC